MSVAWNIHNSVKYVSMESSNRKSYKQLSSDSGNEAQIKPINYSQNSTLPFGFK